MKKQFSRYALVWVICLVVFNVLCFATPNKMAGYTKINNTFWVAYGFITLAFVGQLFCAWKAFQADSAKKMFYNLPLITISYSGLVVMLILGGLVMAVPNLPSWLGVIVCLIVFAFTAIAGVKATAAAAEVERVDEKVKSSTSFIREMTSKAENLMAKAKTPEAREACKRVYEAFRYSNPVSSPELSSIEAKIAEKMDEFSETLFNPNLGTWDIVSDNVINLVEERNRCGKTLK